MNAYGQNYTHPIIQDDSCTKNGGYWYVYLMDTVGGTSVDMKNPGGQGGGKMRLGNKLYIMNANGQNYTHPARYTMQMLSVVGEGRNDRKDGLTPSNKRYWLSARVVRLAQAKKWWQSRSAQHVMRTLSVVGAGRNEQKYGQKKEGDKETRDVTGRQVRTGERVSSLFRESPCQTNAVPH